MTAPVLVQSTPAQTGSPVISPKLKLPVPHHANGFSRIHEAGRVDRMKLGVEERRIEFCDIKLKCENRKYWLYRSGSTGVAQVPIL